MDASIDIGNSRIKVGIFEEHKLIQSQVLEEKSILTYLQDNRVKKIIFSSVGGKSDLVRSLKTNFKTVLEFTKNTPVPMRVHYATPETLGLDRLAAAAGALQNSHGPILVIDMGTCITCDVINEDNIFLGGTISPGLRMRLHSMHTFTTSLPLLELETPHEKIPDSTREAMLSGTVIGAKHEIFGFIDQYKAVYPEIKVIICGGDANYFDKMNELNIFVLPNLVLVGLNAILRFNGEE